MRMARHCCLCISCRAVVVRKNLLKSLSNSIIARNINFVENNWCRHSFESKVWIVLHCTAKSCDYCSLFWNVQQCLRWYNIIDVNFTYLFLNFDVTRITHSLAYHQIVFFFSFLFRVNCALCKWPYQKASRTMAQQKHLFFARTLWISTHNKIYKKINIAQ